MGYSDNWREIRQVDRDLYIQVARITTSRQTDSHRWLTRQMTITNWQLQQRR